MKKLLLFAMVFAGLSPSAFAKTQITNETLAESFVDQTVIALQSIDKEQNGNGGLRYFNGAAVKTDDLTYANLFRVVTTEGSNFVLQRLVDGMYVGNAGSQSNGAFVTNEAELAQAAQFTKAYVGFVNDWTTKCDGVENGVNTFRLKNTANNYLNTNEHGLVPTWKNGSGGFSVWYAYKFTEAEVGTLCAEYSKTLYQQLTGMNVDATDGTISIPGYVSAANAKSLYDAVTAENPSESDIKAAIAATGTASGFETTDGVLYTIKSTDLAARGYLLARDGAVVSSKSASVDFDANSPDFRFGFVTIEGKKYMFSASSKLFLNAFGEKTDYADNNVQNAADYTWRLSEVPTEITKIISHSSGVAHAFCIGGGLTPSSNENFASGQTHEGGIALVGNTNATRSAIVSMGITNRIDGCGFTAEYAGRLTDAELAEITKTATDAHAAVAAACTAVGEINEGDAARVNHYTYETANALSVAVSADHKHFILNAPDARHGITAGHVYTFKDPLSDKYLAAQVNNEISWVDYADDNSCNWLAVDKNGEIYVQHTITDPVAAPATPVAFSAAAPVVVEFGPVTLDPAKLGKVTSGSADYEMVKVSENAADATTTGIDEIGVDAPAANVVYDLQGRRVSRAARGLYIINGVKTLVK